MKYLDGTLELIDQRILPFEQHWLKLSDSESIARAIEDMVVRGAPAIGCTAAYGVAIDALRAPHAKTWREYAARFEQVCTRLAATRPTAVNLFAALNDMRAVAAQFNPDDPLTACALKLEAKATALFDADVGTCKMIGETGAAFAPRDRKLRVLTHCNAGALATAGYGTALGVIRSLHRLGRLEKVYVDETRPFLQGARLTAFELSSEGIPYELICDSAAAYLMQLGQIDWVVLGADRIAANGDTANKIGTYGLAVQCRFHDIPFYVAAPLTTFDLSIPSGAQIPVEQRHAEEITAFRGTPVAPLGTKVFNPSFDVTPNELISGLITEVGVLHAPYTESISAHAGPGASRGAQTLTSCLV